MKPPPEPSTQEVLAGLVERVTVHNAENGFCVLRAKARGRRDLVTKVGHAADIRGIGFKTADANAINLGIERTAMIRLRAGISYALTEAMDEGHCGLPTEQLIPLAEELLEAPKELILTALDIERPEGAVIADKVGETACTFLAGLYRAEQAIADRLNSRRERSAALGVD